MMPRRSPPTAMAFPRSFGSPACSTAAKKASASKWTMTRGIDARRNIGSWVGQSLSMFSIFRFANECAKHSLNHQFLRGNQVGILWVLRLEERFAVFQNESFQCALAVNQRRHGLSVAWI